MPPPLKFYFY